eukprot:GHVS01005597.1.p1 GENE.GHVS01005597.1~~GHVS01005597.1.p1  ORF type:complete len:357 (+),score=70.72 GHVS01005597.1:274-1344(+)
MERGMPSEEAEGGGAGEVFRDPVYLAQNILNHEKNALHYFYRSRFYERNSLNELKLQGAETECVAEGVVFEVTESNLAVLRHSSQCPPDSEPQRLHLYYNENAIFVIKKILLKDEHKMPLRVFYISSGDIYSAPPLGSVLRYQMYMAIQNLELMIGRVDAMNRWSLVEGYKWKVTDSELRQKMLRMKEQMEQTKEEAARGSPLGAEAQSNSGDASASISRPSCRTLLYLAPDRRKRRMEGKHEDDDDVETKRVRAVNHDEKQEAAVEGTNAGGNERKEAEEEGSEEKKEEKGVADLGWSVRQMRCDGIRCLFTKGACEFALNVCESDLKGVWEESQRVMKENETVTAALEKLQSQQ